MSKPFKLAAPRALERDEQAALFKWAAAKAQQDARWSLLFAIPNGTSASSMAEAVKAKKTGRRKGVPDMFLPIPAFAANGDIKHGLFIELKRRDGRTSDLSPEQRIWLAALDYQGYLASVAFGWEHAATMIETYLDGEVLLRTPAGGALTPAGDTGLPGLLVSPPPALVSSDLPTLRATKNRNLAINKAAAGF